MILQERMSLPFRSKKLRWAAEAAAATLALNALAVPIGAQAHAILESSTLVAGASVPAGAVTLQLRYNSRIDPIRSRLTLVRPDQSQLKLDLAPDQPPEVLAASTNLSPGSYAVRWQVLAVDGHITRGSFSFTVTSH